MIAIRGIFSNHLPLRQTGRRWATHSQEDASSSHELITAGGSPGQSVLLLNSGASGDTLADGSRVFSLAGNPTWRDDTLAGIAAQEGNGAAFKTAWRRDGKAAFESMSGGYVAAVVDCDDGYLQLAVDRMGIGRLAYSECEGGVVFSHKVGDVAQFADQAPSVSSQAIFNYLFFHQIPAPGTVYEGISKLRPGHLLQCKGGRIEALRYWTPSFSEDALQRPTTSDMQGALRAGIARSLPVTDAGTFLSGGLDSSTVTGLASQISTLPLPAFTIGFDANGYDEMGFAEVVAEHFGVEHNRYYVTCADVVNSAPFIASNCDEPFGNSSILPTYFCAKLAASNGCTTMLAGDGGDELFGGNERYTTQRIFERFQYLPKSVQSLCKKLASHTTDSPFSVFRKFSSYVSQASIPLPARLETYNLLTMMPLTRIFTADFLDAVKPAEPIDMMKSVYAAAGPTDMLNRLLFLDWEFTLADNDLHKVQTGCSLAGVNAAFPLLDLDIVDLSLRLPISDKLRGNTLRPFFRESTQQFLPASTLTKSKQGFGLPFGIWMRTDGALRAVADDAIQAFSKRNIIQSDFLMWLQEQHRNDHASFYGSIIWVIMMLELWLSAKETA